MTNHIPLFWRGHSGPSGAQQKMGEAKISVRIQYLQASKADKTIFLSGLALSVYQSILEDIPMISRIYSLDIPYISPSLIDGVIYGLSTLYQWEKLPKYQSLPNLVVLSTAPLLLYYFLSTLSTPANSAGLTSLLHAHATPPMTRFSLHSFGPVWRLCGKSPGVQARSKV